MGKRSFSAYTTFQPSRRCRQSKTPPMPPQDSPRGSQAPKTAQWGRQDGPRGSQDGPKMAPRGTQEWEPEPKIRAFFFNNAPGVSKRSPRSPNRLPRSSHHTPLKHNFLETSPPLNAHHSYFALSATFSITSSSSSSSVFVVAAFRVGGIGRKAFAIIGRSSDLAPLKLDLAKYT